MQEKRCGWCLSTPLYQQYHDQEWGMPRIDDATLFEFLLLEGAQAGLSWLTVLNKRAHYRKVYAGFDPNKIARFSAKKVESLLRDPGIIRNRLKIGSAIKNARAYLQLVESGNSLSNFLWQFCEGHVQVNHYQNLRQVPATTSVSDAMSKALKQAGFNFVGSTIIYAYMQAVGMVNDHLMDCPARKRCLKSAKQLNLLP